jgi:prepilin-type processing-associated H-X9-DG protein
MRQVGMAIAMYTQDWDEGLVLDTHSGADATWIETLQPYTKNRLMNRCPDDSSANFERPLTGQTALRRVSYGINGYLTPAGGYVTLASVRSPAQTVYVGELADNKTGDHFHAPQWPVATNPLTEVAAQRHQGGANYVFVDGHARWSRFEQTFSLPGINAWDPSR